MRAAFHDIQNAGGATGGLDRHRADCQRTLSSSSPCADPPPSCSKGMALVAVEAPAPQSAPTFPRLPSVEVVVPTHNEAHVLEASITRLHRYLVDRFPLPWRITI